MSKIVDSMDEPMEVGDLTWDDSSDPANPGWVVKVRAFTGSGTALEPLGGPNDQDRAAPLEVLTAQAALTVAWWRRLTAN